MVRMIWNVVIICVGSVICADCAGCEFYGIGEGGRNLVRMIWNSVVIAA